MYIPQAQVTDGSPPGKLAPAPRVLRTLDGSAAARQHRPPEAIAVARSRSRLSSISGPMEQVLQKLVTRRGFVLLLLDHLRFLCPAARRNRNLRCTAHHVRTANARDWILRVALGSGPSRRRTPWWFGMACCRPVSESVLGLATAFGVTRSSRVTAVRSQGDRPGHTFVGVALASPRPPRDLDSPCAARPRRLGSNKRQRLTLRPC